MEDGRGQCRIGASHGQNRFEVFRVAGAQQRPDLIDLADAATDGERNEDLVRRPLDKIDQRRPALRSRVDIEERELVRPILGVGSGQRDRIPLVSQLPEVRPLHNAASGGIETGDDPLEQHVDLAYAAASTFAKRRKFSSRRNPAVPLRSGWNCTPTRPWRAIALTKGTPWVVSPATTAGWRGTAT